MLPFIHITSLGQHAGEGTLLVNMLLVNEGASWETLRRGHVRKSMHLCKKNGSEAYELQLFWDIAEAFSR